MKPLLTGLLVVTTLALGGHQGNAQPSEAVCVTTPSGNQLCVRFDNRAAAPEQNVDFIVVSAEPPGVALLVGQSTDGSLHQWRLWCVDSVGSPADIASITSPGAYNYAVKLRQPGGAAGARNVGTVTLEPSGDHHTSITSGELTGDLTGALNLRTDTIGGGGVLDLIVNGSVSGTITAPTVNTLRIAGPLSGGVIIRHLETELRLVGLAGSGASISIDGFGTEALANFYGLTFGATMELGHGIPTGAAVTISGSLEDAYITLKDTTLAGTLSTLRGGSGLITGIGDLSGVLELNTHEETEFSGLTELGRVTVDGVISLPAGDLSGQIVVGGDMEGNITLRAGDIDPAGLIRVLGDMTGKLAIEFSQPGFLLRGGDFRGYLQVDGDLSGRVRIHRSLIPQSLGQTMIRVDGSLGSTGAITVDYEGWDSPDAWQAGAMVTVGANTYAQNTPAARVWEVTACKGDLNNDGSVDFFDIDPFLLALFDPTGYEAAFPGLEGSMVFHADFGGATGGGCNGVVDFFDTDPFVARALSGECCPLCEYETCFPGLAAPSGDAPTAAIVADALVNYTASARRDALIALMTAPGDADDAGAAQRVAFWTAVAAEIDARE